MGDGVALLNGNTAEQFATALITRVYEKAFRDITGEECAGQGTYTKMKEKALCVKYYPTWTESSVAKIIHFKLNL